MSFFACLRALLFESINKKSFLVMLAIAVCISALAGYVVRYDMFGVYENAKVGFFILVCCCLWMGMFDSLLAICDQRTVLERDKFSGLHISAFMFASIVFRAWHALLQTAILFGITYLLIEWPSNAPQLLFGEPANRFVTLYLITCASQMLGLAVSAVVKRNQHALTFAPFMLIYELIMSETLFGLPAWLEPLRETTIVRWGLNALGSLYDIDTLPWQGEGKLDEILAMQADSAAQSISQWNANGADAVRNAILNMHIDPSVMGVNHDLAEYTAAAGSVLFLWVGLAVLALIAAVIAFAGFKRKVDWR